MKSVGIKRSVGLIVVQFIAHFYLVRVLSVDLQEHENDHDEPKQTPDI